MQILTSSKFQIWDVMPFHIQKTKVEIQNNENHQL